MGEGLQEVGPWMQGGSQPSACIGNGLSQLPPTPVLCSSLGPKGLQTGREMISRPGAKGMNANAAIDTLPLFPAFLPTHSLATTLPPQQVGSGQSRACQPGGGKGKGTSGGGPKEGASPCPSWELGCHRSLVSHSSPGPVQRWGETKGLHPSGQCATL